MKFLAILSVVFLLSGCAYDSVERPASVYTPLYETVKDPAIHFDFQSNQMKMLVPERVAFGTKRATLTSEFQSDLVSLATFLKEHPDMQIHLTGYSFADSEKSAKALSLRRVDAVSNFLRSQGIDVNRLKTQGVGEKRTSGQQNRVEILLNTLGEK